MKRTHLLLSAVAALTGKAIPPVPTVPALDDAGKPRVDAAGAPEMVEDAAAGPALSEADAALLKQMSPEAQAALGAALGAVVAPAEMEAEDPAEEVAEEEAEVAADVEQDTEMLAPVLADIAAIKAALEAAGIKVGAPKGDEMPMPSAMKMDAPKTTTPSRKDSAAVTTPAKPTITIDADAIIAKAEAAASKRFDANAAFVQTVRNDHAEVATVEQAATVMLTTIKAHLPDLSGMAEEALKGGRFDSLTTFYKQAEGIRRDSLLARQGADLGRVLASADLGTNGGGNIVRAPAPGRS